MIFTEPERLDVVANMRQYVNSYPVTSVKYGIQNLSPNAFGGPPDIVVAVRMTVRRNMHYRAMLICSRVLT